MDISNSDPRLPARIAERVAGLGARGDASLVPEGVPRAFAERALRRLAARLTSSGPLPDGSLPAEKVSVLCDALVSGDGQVAGDTLAMCGLDRTTPDQIYEAVFAAAARELGERWVADRISFVDVTVAMGRIQALVRDFDDEFGPLRGRDPNGPFAIFAPVPGETHTFGLSLAADYFGRAGWRVDLLGDVSTGTLVSEVLGRGPDVVGLTAGSRRMLPVVRDTIAALRAAGAASLICVGGHLVELEPDLAGLVGADHAVHDAVSAAARLRRILRTEENATA